MKISVENIRTSTSNLTLRVWDKNCPFFAFEVRRGHTGKVFVCAVILLTRGVGLHPTVSQWRDQTKERAEEEEEEEEGRSLPKMAQLGEGRPLLAH